MGYNTVAVIMNDPVGMMGKDPEFGARVDAAVRAWHGREPYKLDLEASAVVRHDNGSVGVHGAALRVISQAHADEEQVVIVSRNAGQRIQDANGLGWQALDAMKACLERHGWLCGDEEAEGD